MKGFKIKFLNQKGQALFEMILFLPFLLFLYTIYYTAGNAINGSINQQKAVRGYLYVLLKGNSYVSNLNDLKDLKAKNVSRVGFSAVGWRLHADAGDKNSFAPCFKFSSLLKNNSSEECDSPDRDEPESSRFIRLFTFYGICGPTYTTNPNGGFALEPMLQAASGGYSCGMGAN